MNWKSLLKLLASAGIGVWLQFWAVIFAFWYGDVLNDIFCDSSFYGSPDCSEPRPLETILIWGVLIGSLLFGSTLPALLFGARWWQVLLVFLLTPLLTSMLYLVPIVLFFVLLASGN